MEVTFIPVIYLTGAEKSGEDSKNRRE